MNDQVAKHGDKVISKSRSWNGHDLFGSIATVDKTYKSGNVVLVGAKDQYYFRPHGDGGYTLTSCSGSSQYVLLTQEVEQERVRSKAIDHIINRQYEFGLFLNRNKRAVTSLEVDDLVTINSHMDEITKIISKGIR